MGNQMLFHESIECFAQISEKVQRVLTELKQLESNSNKHLKEVEEIENINENKKLIENALCKVYKLEQRKEVLLEYILGYLNSQVEVVNEDTRNFNKMVSEYSLESVKIKEKGVCSCGGEPTDNMVACDNATCKVGWYYLKCAGISDLPESEWYCDECIKNQK